MANSNLGTVQGLVKRAMRNALLATVLMPTVATTIAAAQTAAPSDAADKGQILNYADAAKLLKQLDSLCRPNASCKIEVPPVKHRSGGTPVVPTVESLQNSFWSLYVKEKKDANDIKELICLLQDIYKFKDGQMQFNKFIIDRVTDIDVRVTHLEEIEKNRPPAPGQAAAPAPQDMSGFLRVITPETETHNTVKMMIEGIRQGTYWNWKDAFRPTISGLPTSCPGLLLIFGVTLEHLPRHHYDLTGEYKKDFEEFMRGMPADMPSEDAYDAILRVRDALTDADRQKLAALSIRDKHLDLDKVKRTWEAADTKATNTRKPKDIDAAREAKFIYDVVKDPKAILDGIEAKLEATILKIRLEKETDGAPTNAAVTVHRLNLYLVEKQQKGYGIYDMEDPNAPKGHFKPKASLEIPGFLVMPGDNGMGAGGKAFQFQVGDQPVIMAFSGRTASVITKAGIAIHLLGDQTDAANSAITASNEALGSKFAAIKMWSPAQGLKFNG